MSYLNTFFVDLLIKAHVKVGMFSYVLKEVLQSIGPSYKTIRIRVEISAIYMLDQRNISRP
jgi:hypothetical protein